MSSSTPSEPLASTDSEQFDQTKKSILALLEDQWDTQYALRRAMRLLTGEQLGRLFDDVADYFEQAHGETPRRLLVERFGDTNRDRL